MHRTAEKEGALAWAPTDDNTAKHRPVAASRRPIAGRSNLVPGHEPWGGAHQAAEADLKGEDGWETV
jgi:hypothetical protein